MRLWKKIQTTILSKETLRAYDYRKATILIYIKIKDLICDKHLVQLFCTAVEICKICYSREAERIPRVILWLHNVTFLHAYLCTKLFSSPKTVTRRMFGRYFHSIITRIPLLYRIVCLCSVNAEKQERMFGQSKQITKATSNNHPNHIIVNIIERLQIECAQSQPTGCSPDESSIGSLAMSVGTIPNTIITEEIMTEVPNHYQAHLERIGDFLSKGSGVWWKQHDLGIEFFDSVAHPDFHSLGPQIMHFRSKSMQDVDFHLLQQWEECISSGIPLPAVEIRTYSTNGDLVQLAQHLLPTDTTSTELSLPPDVTDATECTSTQLSLLPHVTNDRVH